MQAGSDWRRWKPSPAMAVSWVAVFIALGGSALALQANSVGPRHIKDNAVRSSHIKNGQVKNQDVRNLNWGKLSGVPAGFADGIDNTGGGGGPASDVQCTGCVHTADLASNSVNSAKVANSSIQRIDLAPAGRVPNVVTRVDVSSLSANPVAFASCNAGEVAVGGGARGNNFVDAWIRTSQPSPITDGTTPTGWTTASRQANGASHTVTAFVLCARP